MSTAPKSVVQSKPWSSRIPIVWNGIFFALMFAIALAILRRWGSPQPWSAVDRYIIAILILSLLYCVQQLILYPNVFKTRGDMEFFVGKHFDPNMPALLALIGALEMLGFADYAHWHLVPALRAPALQISGIVVMSVGLVWLFYVDRYVSRRFLEAWKQHSLMTEGPYRWLRHPRYLALLLSRLGYALLIASVIVYFVFIAWVAVVILRIVREERFLRAEFGAEYEQFMRTRSRLIPGIY